MFCNHYHDVDCTCIVCRRVPAKIRKIHPIGFPHLKTVKSGTEGVLKVKRPTPGQFTGKVEPVWGDDEFLQDHPNLADHLRSVKYEDGVARQTSTLMLFSDNGTLKLCLNDRDNARSVFVSGQNIMEAFELLEKGLRESSLDWKMKGNRPGGQGYTPF